MANISIYLSFDEVKEILRVLSVQKIVPMKLGMLSSNSVISNLKYGHPQIDDFDLMMEWIDDGGYAYIDLNKESDIDTDDYDESLKMPFTFERINNAINESYKMQKYDLECYDIEPMVFDRIVRGEYDPADAIKFMEFVAFGKVLDTNID